MKNLLLILLTLLLTNTAISKAMYQLELGTSVSIHHMNYAPVFKNKVFNSTGKYVTNDRLHFNIISNNLNVYTKFTIGIGKDCLNSFIVGSTYTLGYSWKNIKIGIPLGFYLIKTKIWKDNLIEKYWIGNGAIGVVPAVGVDVDVTLYQKDNLSISFKNYINPFISNHMLSISVDF